MPSKHELLIEIEAARQLFQQLLEAIPEADYGHPSDNPAWTVGDILHHITLGPTAIAFEVWMLLHAHGLFRFAMKVFPTALFNRVNAWFSRTGTRRVRRAELETAYQNGHARLKSVLEGANEPNLAKSVTYPADFVPELAGEVTVERLIHYVKSHVETHAAQIGKIRV